MLGFMEVRNRQKDQTSYAQRTQKIWWLWAAVALLGSTSFLGYVWAWTSAGSSEILAVSLALRESSSFSPTPNQNCAAPPPSMKYSYDCIVEPWYVFSCIPSARIVSILYNRTLFFFHSWANPQASLELLFFGFNLAKWQVSSTVQCCYLCYLGICWTVVTACCLSMHIFSQRVGKEYVLFPDPDIGRCFWSRFNWCLAFRFLYRSVCLHLYSHKASFSDSFSLLPIGTVTYGQYLVVFCDTQEP